MRRLACCLTILAAIASVVWHPATARASLSVEVEAGTPDGLPFEMPALPPGTHAGTLEALDQMGRLRLTAMTQISYRTHAGSIRRAIVLAPRYLSPGRRLPLVIVPHGRAGDPAHTCDAFGDLPGYSSVVVVCPQGQGRVWLRDSWGYAGEIDDLARMPAIVQVALPGVSIDRREIFAIGASMGGQEALLLAGRFPNLLAGVVAIDPVTNLAVRFLQMRRLPGGARLQWLMAREVGATPQQDPLAYAVRSPVSYAPEIARSRTFVCIWWSHRDYNVYQQWDTQSGAFLRALAAENPQAPVWQRVGDWSHSWVFRHRMWTVFGSLGLLPQFGLPEAPGVAWQVSRGIARTKP